MRPTDRASLIQALAEVQAAKPTARHARANYMDALDEYDAAVEALVKAAQLIETHEAEKEICNA